jgi:hypothetical protein
MRPTLPVREAAQIRIPPVRVHHGPDVWQGAGTDRSEFLGRVYGRR